MAWPPALTLPRTLAAQRHAGLVQDGIVGPKTKQLLTAEGLRNDAGPSEARYKSGTVTWTILADTLPVYLETAAVEAELAAAFGAWAGPTGLTFEHVAADAQVTISFVDHTATNEFAFDGPGGALAKATAEAIAFDSSERWELRGAPHRHREVESGDAWWAEASVFQLHTVALHEIGHVIGLSHSTEPGDIMSPYYFPGQLLSDADKAAAAAIVAS